MRELVLNWLCEVTERDRSQFFHIPDDEVFSMFFDEVYTLTYEVAEENYKKKKRLQEIADALAKGERERWRW